MSGDYVAELRGTAADGAAALRDRFAEQVPAERPRLRMLAWRFGLPPAELDDAVQEVLTRAWAGLDGFRGEAALSTWLTRIAIRTYTSRRRGWMRRIKGVLYDAEAANTVAAAPDVSPEQMEAYGVARACILKLPPKLRTVFVLRYLEEMSSPEVAALLAIPEATVRTRVYHARKKLRAMMKGYEP